MEKPKWGILGTGWIARLFVKDLLLTGHEVLAVGSRKQATADTFAKAFGIARAHGAYSDLLNDPEIDIIYIATPHVFHAQNALDALAAGKHVLVEKCFTLNGQEARRVVELAREKRLVVLEAMWTRFLPHMVRLREIIAEDRIGEVRAIDACHLQHLSEEPDHRLNSRELGGGALLDLGIYPISFAYDLLGPPVKIEAQARMRSTGVDAAVAVLCQHQGGGLSTSLSALDLPGPNRATVIGTRGSVSLDSFWYMPTSFEVQDSDGNVVETYRSDVVGRGMQYQAVEMERLVNLAPGTESAIMPPDQSIGIMDVLDGVRNRIGLCYPGE